MWLSGLDDKPTMNKFVEYFKDKLVTGGRDYSFNKHSKFYLVKHRNNYFVVIEDVITKRGDLIVKRCFNRFGDLILKVIDSKLTSNDWRRKLDNNTIFFNGKNEVIRSEKNITFKSIKADHVNSEDKGLPNSNIGVIDLETFEKDSRSNCYAIGFYSVVDSDCQIFYIDRNIDSTLLICKCINQLLSDKYKNIVFYCHNLGRFDAPFIIKALSLFNGTAEGKENPYSFDTITRNSDILKLTIKRRIDGKMRRLRIHDSVGLLPNSLRDLCKDFSTKTHKDIFPYLFCNIDTLFYVGETPDIKYYENLLDGVDISNCDNKTVKKLKKEKYKSIYKKNWSLKVECEEYLKKDLKSLYDVLLEFSKTLYLLFDVQMTDNLTISGVAMRIFLNKYYDPTKNPLPLIDRRNYFSDIHKAYYGGRVEVYNPKITNTECYYYDVNSLYPYASLNPMPGLKASFVENIDDSDDSLNLEKLFGFFYCEIEYYGKYLGLLPYRTEKSSLLFPIGKWCGWYFSEELKFAQQNGYKIKVIKGYNFNKSNSVFDNFVTDIYKIKSNSKNNSEKKVAKLLLNSLIGKFGMDFLKPVTKLFTKEKNDLIYTTRLVRNSIEIDEDLYLTSFIPPIDKNVCEEFGLDYIKVLNSENYDETKSIGSYKSVSISTAAATIAYARIYMAKMLLYVLNNNGKLYYTDTDSIVTDLKLPDNIVHPTELGKFKLEYTIVEGYFIADKTYAIKTKEGLIIKKSKGVDSKSLEFKDYEKLYNMDIINYASKTSAFRDYPLGSVTIKKKNNIIINPNYYIKRRRKYLTTPLEWIGTNPVNINKLCSIM